MSRRITAAIAAAGLMAAPVLMGAEGCEGGEGPAQKTVKELRGTGTYEVTHSRRGTWKAIDPTPQCKWVRYPKKKHKGRKNITGTSRRVTLTAEDAKFSTSGCGIWRKG